MLIWTVGASLLTIVAMLGAAGLVLTVREDARARLLSHVLSYAVGTLLGTAFLGLLPHALEHGDQKAILRTALSGIVLFFAAEHAACAPRSTTPPAIWPGSARSTAPGSRTTSSTASRRVGGGWSTSYASTCAPW